MSALTEFAWWLRLDAIIAEMADGWKRLTGTHSWQRPDGQVVDRRFLPRYHHDLAHASRVADKYNIIALCRDNGPQLEYMALLVGGADCPGDTWIVEGRYLAEAATRPLALTKAIVHLVTGQNPDDFEDNLGDFYGQYAD